MKTTTVSTRRRFFTVAGAALSAPLVLAAPRRAAARDDPAELAARLAALEDEKALRKLCRAYVRHFNAEARGTRAAPFADGAPWAEEDAGIRRIVAADFDEQAAVEVAVSRKRATVRMPCTVEIETAIGVPGCTLIDMARAQGEGVLEHREPRVLQHVCVRGRDGWRIERTMLAPSEEA